MCPRGVVWVERAFRLRLCGFQLRRERGGSCNVLVGLVAVTCRRSPRLLGH
jgi:hypothetical protein